MSKLLEKLERISEGRDQPMGFSAAVTRAKSSPIVVVASVPRGNAEVATIAAKGGADALLVTVEHLGKESEALAQIGSPESDIPWGVSLETVTKKGIKQLIEMGCDFVVFTPAKMPVAILGEERIGKVIQIDPSLSDSLAKSISRLPIDAVLLSPDDMSKSPLTVQQLMIYERLASGAGKHLLAAVPPGLPIDDLESLWGLGARGVVVDMAVEHPEQRLSQVRKAIQELPTREKKARGKISAVLPLSKGWTDMMPPEEEEEEEI